MNKIILSILVLILGISCKDLSTSSEKPTATFKFDLLLENGTIINLETGELSKRTIAIREGRIVEIIADYQNQNLSADSIIDITGKYVLPGYWDNHVHFRGGDSLKEANRDFLKLFIKNGITTVRDAGGDLGEYVIEWRDLINEGRMVGPTIFTAGPKIDGPKARWAGSLEVDSKEDVSAAVDSLEQMSVDFVKLYDSTISGESYLLAIKEAKKRNLIVSGHMPFSVSLDETIEAGIDGVEHLYYVLKGSSTEEKSITNSVKNGELGFWDSMSRLIETYSDSTAKQTFRHLRENNVFVVPTLHIGNVISYLDEVDHSQDEYLKYMTDGLVKTYEGRINSALRSSEEARENRKALNSSFQELTKELNDANVSLLAGSDCGAYNCYVYPGISLHQELEALVSAGLSPLEALRTSAYNGAKFLKMDADYGIIDEGKIADLVILNSNPLNTIESSRDIYRTVKDGNIVKPLKMN